MLRSCCWPAMDWLRLTSRPGFCAVKRFEREIIKKVERFRLANSYKRNFTFNYCLTTDFVRDILSRISFITESAPFVPFFFVSHSWIFCKSP